MTAPFLQRLYFKDGAALQPEEFPGTLPFVRNLDVNFTHPVTFFVGENGSGKSTVVEAIADLAGLPTAGGGKNDVGAVRAGAKGSELAPFLRAAFRKKPTDGYFFRAEFLADFANLLDHRKADPAFSGDPYGRYGGRSLHTRSHGEAFLAMFSAWLRPGLIVMDEPEAALSPQRQLALLMQMATLAKMGGVQLIIATHSPVLLTYPGATILAFEGETIEPVRLEDTSHYQITKGVLDAPERFWKHLLEEHEES